MLHCVSPVGDPAIEIEDLQAAVMFDHHIGGFDVSVDDPRLCA
jgi:hypothetical protein